MRKIFCQKYLIPIGSVNFILFHNKVLSTNLFLNNYTVTFTGLSSYLPYNALTDISLTKVYS